MEKLKIIVTIALVLFEVITAIIACVMGFKNKKRNVELTIELQKEDLYSYMVKECSTIEVFSKFLKTSMTKVELSTYKRETVMRNIKLYAQANGYSWYDESVWGDVLTKYIDEANAVAGKTAK